MKKRKGRILVLFLAVLLVSVLSCKNPFLKKMLVEEEKGSESPAVSDTPAPLPLDAGSFEDTDDGFIKIIPPVNGIIGTAFSYPLPKSKDYWKGVFIAGRKVTLSPYKLGDPFSRQDGGNLRTLV